MASATIQLTPEMLRGKAGEVRNYRSQHDDTMGKIKNLVYALNEISALKGKSISTSSAIEHIFFSVFRKINS